MDLLPKQMCHRCSYKLEEFHKFYSECLKTDRDLKSQLSWMRKREVEEDVRVPMVQIENVKIKSEPPDYDIYELDPIVENVNYIKSMSGMTFSMNNVRNNNVDSNRIIDVDECFTCDRLAELGPTCRCSYRKSTNSSKAAIARETTVRPRAGRSNTRSSSSKRSTEKQNGNTSKNETTEIVIKTEKPDVVSEPRSLRPRNKSIDYIGTKRKKSMIVNPASVRRRTSTAKGQIVNGIVINEIKKEPQDEHQRILRPRKLLVDYIGSKRKKTETQEGNKGGDNRIKRRKSSATKEKANIIPVEKRISRLFPNLEFKVKQEILSDDVNTNVNRDVPNCVSNLSSLFDRETELAVKREIVKDGFLENRTQAIASGSQPVSKIPLLKKFITSKTKPRKVSASRISGTNCSPKYLRSQDLPLRNGKVKKTDSDQLLSLGSLKRRNLFLEQSKKGRSIGGKNVPAKTRENLNVIRVPTSLKNPSNIKQYCEKCNNSFMNRELYRLHACYTD